MVAGVVKFFLKLDQQEEAIRYLNSKVGSTRDSSPLFKGKLKSYVVLVDRKTGHGYSIGFWDDLEHSRDFERSKLFHEIVAGLGKFCVRPPTREQFDVVGGELEALLSSRRPAA